MLRRFVSAAAVGSIVIALAASTLYVSAAPVLEGRYLIATIWCLVPVVWGLWAMLLPATWIPRRIPVWGAILGLVAGTTAGFVLHLPTRVFGVEASTWWHVVVLIAAIVLYWLLWMPVRTVYGALRRPV